MKYLVFFICFFLIHCNQKKSNPSGVSPDPAQPATVQTTNLTPSNVNHSQRWFGSLSISNTNIYRDFLQAYGICDGFTWNVGTAKCDKWDSSADVELIFEQGVLPSPVELKITPLLETSSDPYFFQPQHNIVMKGEANLADDNYGFQAYLSEHSARFGALRTNFSVIIKSKGGTPEERIINMDIFYGGQAHQDVRIGNLDLENSSKPVSTSDMQLTPGR